MYNFLNLFFVRDDQRGSLPSTVTINFVIIVTFCLSHILFGLISHGQVASDLEKLWFNCIFCSQIIKVLIYWVSARALLKVQICLGKSHLKKRIRVCSLSTSYQARQQKEEILPWKFSSVTRNRWLCFGEFKDTMETNHHEATYRGNPKKMSW